MKAIFYDRKNKREVSSDQLNNINLVETYLTVDADEINSGEWDQKKHKGYLHERKISDLGYKSENCGNHQNWDLHTSLVNLIFLRLE